jgi:hypothetical protein
MTDMRSTVESCAGAVRALALDPRWFSTSSADGTRTRVPATVRTSSAAAGQVDRIVSAESTITRVHQHGATLKRDTGGRMELEEFLAFLREIERTYRHVDDVGIADGPGSDDPPGPFPAAVGPRGDLAALLAQDPADRLDRVILGFYEVDEAHDQRVRGSSSPAKSCGPAQDLDALAQPTVLGLERHYLGQLLARRTGTLPAVDLGLDHSPAHRLLADAELLGHGRRSCRERGVLPLVVSDETYCSGRGCLIHFVSSRYEHAVIGGIVHHADVLTPRRRQLPAPGRGVDSLPSIRTTTDRTEFWTRDNHTPLERQTEQSWRGVHRRS